MARRDVLIDAHQLAAAMDSGRAPVVADCRFALADTDLGERAYRESHVPGAHYLHLERELSAPRQALGGRHPLPEAARFEAAMRRIGLHRGQLLVAYDDSRGAFAARLWWLARYFGHAQVRVLDGGFRAWREAGLPVSAAVPGAGHADFTARPDPGMRVDFEDLVRDAGQTLVDSREPRRYQGLEEPIDPVAGHIPGALNRPWAEATGESGVFLDEAAQAARWQALGPARELVVYCGSGVTACVNLLSLELAGRSGARLYPGSWSDWCARAGAGIAKGPEPG